MVSLSNHEQRESRNWFVLRASGLNARQGRTNRCSDLQRLAYGSMDVTLARRGDKLSGHGEPTRSIECSLVAPKLGMGGMCGGGACAHPGARPSAPSASPPPQDMTRHLPLIPWPSSVTLSGNERFSITKDTIIEVSPGQPELQRIGRELADLLRPALDRTIAVREGTSGTSTALGEIPTRNQRAERRLGR